MEITYVYSFFLNEAKNGASWGVWCLNVLSGLHGFYPSILQGGRGREREREGERICLQTYV
jgi:hypothetical protein